MSTRSDRRLRVDPADANPLWSQIEDGVRRLVASGAWRPAASVPSVRDLARELRVNPATVVKAYARLADAGVLEVRRGDGTYVSARPPAVTDAARAQDLGEAARRYAALAFTSGATREQALGAVREAWAALAARKGGDSAR